MLPAGRIDTAGLFPGLHRHLIELLRSLTAADWEKPTACQLWSVRDIAAHLLDGDIRRLSLGRDRMIARPDTPIENYGDLVGFLNRLNADWVRALRRASPQVLIDLLEHTGPQISEYFAGLDPEGVAVFPVAWAGEETSANWFDIGQDFTERWHHQQQIRDAVGAAPLTARQWLYPVLSLFLRAVPVAYRSTPGEEGDAVEIYIVGTAGGSWTLFRQEGRWELYEGHHGKPAAQISLPQEVAWKLFTKGMSAAEADRYATFGGNCALGAVFLNTVAVMG